MAILYALLALLLVGLVLVVAVAIVQTRQLRGRHRRSWSKSPRSGAHP